MTGLRSLLANLLETGRFPRAALTFMTNGIDP